MTNIQIDMQVDDFATFMFKENTNNARIELSLGGVENNKDLFCFFVDILCKGLVILYGKDNKIQIDDLTIHEFEMIKNKMLLAGIQVTLETEENINHITPRVNIREIEFIDDNAALDQFHLQVISTYLIYRIKFNVIHSTTT